MSILLGFGVVGEDGATPEDEMVILFRNSSRVMKVCGASLSHLPNALG
jgi:hypothetical protein